MGQAGGGGPDTSFIRVVAISIVVGVVGTGTGGIIVSLWGSPKRKVLALFLGVSAGVMISMATFDLMPEAFAEAGTYLSLAALLAGALATMAVDLVLPHSHHLTSDRESSRFARTAVVIAAGIGMHDLPEGLAVGASFGAALSLGLRIATLMFLHNVPEGMAVAAPLAAMRKSRRDIILVSACTGLPSVLGTAIGSAISVSPLILAFSLAFSAGAMLFVTFDELIPGAQELAGGHAGTLGAVAGMIAGISLSRLLGR